MLKKYLLFLTTIPFLISPLFSQPDALKDFPKFAKQVLNDWQTPGAAVAVVQNDQLVYARGFGVRELGKPEKVDRNTLFAVASNTKAFTAALLGQLVDKGALHWDDRVIDHYPALHMFDPYLTRELNIRDLLTHRSGLPTYGGDHLWIGNDLNREEIISRLRYLAPVKPFRTQYQYQNLMYLLAGEVAAKIAGESWDTAIEETFFKPLNISRTNTSIRDLEGLDNVAKPHEQVDGVLKVIEYDFLDNVAPAAAINSSVIDMAQWMRVNLNNGKLGEEQIIPPHIVDDMQQVQFPIGVGAFNHAYLNAEFAGYGLGWVISQYDGYKSVSHTGGMSGMISIQLMIPEKQLGVIVFTNRAPTSAIRVLAYHLTDLFLGKTPRAWNQIYLERQDRIDAYYERKEKELQSSRKSNTNPSHNLQDYTGTYSSHLSGDATVTLENGTLKFYYNERHHGTLEHWHFNTFRVHWVHPIFDMDAKTFLRFEMDQKGEIEKLIVTFYDPLEFVKN